MPLLAKVAILEAILNYLNSRGVKPHQSLKNSPGFMFNNIFGHKKHSFHKTYGDLPNPSFVC